MGLSLYTKLGVLKGQPCLHGPLLIRHPAKGTCEAVATAIAEFTAGDGVVIEPVMVPACGTQAGSQCVLDNRAGDAPAQHALAIFTDVCFQRGGKLVARCAGLVVDGAGEGRASVEGVLGTLDDLDLLDIEQHGVNEQ